jgi:hypothetical protein
MSEATIWQSSSSSVFLFTSGGAYAISPEARFNPIEEWIPTNTWALIDAASDFEKPALVLLDAGDHFNYVLATSPRSKHWDSWHKVGGRLSLYYVEPWSLGELIAA